MGNVLLQSLKCWRQTRVPAQTLECIKIILPPPSGKSCNKWAEFFIHVLFFSCKRVQRELQHSWLISKSFIYCTQLCFFIFLQHVESPVKWPNCCYSNSIYALIVKWKTDGGFNFNGIHYKNCVHALNIIYHFLYKHFRLKELMISHMKFFSSITKIKGNCALVLRSLRLESVVQQFGNCQGH